MKNLSSQEDVNRELVGEEIGSIIVDTSHSGSIAIKTKQGKTVVFNIDLFGGAYVGDPE